MIEIARMCTESAILHICLTCESFCLSLSISLVCISVCLSHNFLSLSLTLSLSLHLCLCESFYMPRFFSQCRYVHIKVGEMTAFFLSFYFIGCNKGFQWYTGHASCGIYLSYRYHGLHLKICHISRYTVEKQSGNTGIPGRKSLYRLYWYIQMETLNVLNFRFRSCNAILFLL